VTADEVRWEEPRPKTHGRPPWTLSQKQQRQLKARPGRWALVRTTRSKRLPPEVLRMRHEPGFDFTTRGTTLPGGKVEYGIYAKWEAP
jgi:hypothetical protein